MLRIALHSMALLALALPARGDAPSSKAPSSATPQTISDPAAACAPAKPADRFAKTEVCGAPGAAVGPLQSTTAAEIRARAAAASARVTVVNVWATWCEPCREELPLFAKLRAAYAGKGVRVELVSADSDAKTARAYWDKLKLDVPSFLVSEPLDRFVAEMKRDWSAGLPATFLLDSAGRQTRFWVGKSSYAKLAHEVDLALAAGSKPAAKPVK